MNDDDDVFLFTAAAKGKFEIVKLLLKHGADPTKQNRQQATPLNLVREGDDDVADLLRGNSAILEAAKKGSLARVQRFVTPENINCRDSQGRNSTLLHLAGNLTEYCEKRSKNFLFEIQTKFIRKFVFICSWIQ